MCLTFTQTIRSYYYTSIGRWLLGAVAIIDISEFRLDRLRARRGACDQPSKYLR
eukprot:COSAG06_NODE_18527_length_883_cov_1.019133_1_plen_53_part_01